MFPSTIHVLYRAYAYVYCCTVDPCACIHDFAYGDSMVVIIVVVLLMYFHDFCTRHLGGPH